MPANYSNSARFLYVVLNRHGMAVALSDCPKETAIDGIISDTHSSQIFPCGKYRLAGHYILANLSRHGLRHYLRFHFRRALSPADACLTEATGPKGSDARCAFPIIATTVRPTSVAFRSTRPLSLLQQPISMLSDPPHYFECTHGPRIAKIL
jgi:hypothetical protein